jgi:S-adenosyl-L-methionine hydrolase (adenosine-forming)
MPAMAASERPIVTLLTDFGLDGAVAAVKGVILGICRDAQIIDVGHTIRKFAIRDGAFLLRFSLPYVPVGTHVAVVDPGVGTARRPIALRTGRGDVLIGPDNGLLPAAGEALGGIAEARELTNRELWLPATTSTFHGRDIFAPVAGNLAAGRVAFGDVGPEIAVDELVRLDEPQARASEDLLETTVTYVDSFGNLRLAGGAQELATLLGEDPADGTPLGVEFGGATPVHEPSRYATTFGAVPHGASLVYIDSLGNLAMADNQGSLATRLGIGHDRPVRITRA